MTYLFSGFTSSARRSKECRIGVVVDAVEDAILAKTDIILSPCVKQQCAEELECPALRLLATEWEFERLGLLKEVADVEGVRFCVEDLRLQVELQS